VWALVDIASARCRDDHFAIGRRGHADFKLDVARLCRTGTGERTQSQRQCCNYASHLHEFSFTTLRTRLGCRNAIQEGPQRERASFRKLQIAIEEQDILRHMRRPPADSESCAHAAGWIPEGQGIRSRRARPAPVWTARDKRA
jgi:hypothetical protein